MPGPPHRALRIFLRVFSLLAVVGGLLMIFAEKPLIVRIFLRPPEGEVSTLLLALLKETGGMALMLGVTDIGRVYPAYFLWVRSVVRLAIAALLYWLRPQEARWEPTGNF
jgi:hypothetical protein